MKTRAINPRYFNLFIFLSIVLHFVFPIQVIIQGPVRYLGLGIILLGGAMNVLSLRQLRKMNTAVDFKEPSSRLVKEGPFRFSRNPVYLGGVMLLLGIAVTLGSLITFAFPVIMLLILDRVHVPYEEKLLESRFGSEYLEYKRSVRRWL